MKLFLLLAVLVLTVWPFGSGAQTDWLIERFDSAIEIENNGSVLVRETIKVDFASLEKHGIFRDLPVIYQRDSGGNVYTQVSDIEILQDGSPAEFENTRNGANMRIRIGDPDKTIAGKHEYVISYRVLGALQSFDGLDELNWNVTGNDWEVPIMQANATVKVPAEIIQTACYEGVFGSTTSCPEKTQENSIVHFTAGQLAPGSGLTVAVGYAPGIIPVVILDAPPTLFDSIFSPAAMVSGIVAIASGVIWIIRRWWLYGRDRHWQRSYLPGERSDREGKKLPEKILPLFFRRPISVEYDSPDGLRPAEIGVLMDERADTLDVSSTIVDLAARGYLTIKEIPKTWMFGKNEYEFTRTEKTSDGLLKYESELLSRLFDEGKQAKLSDLKNKFYKDLAKVKDLLYEEVVRKKIFATAPNRARQLAAAKSVGIGVVGGLILGMAFWWLVRMGAWHVGQDVLAGLGIGSIVVGIISLMFSRQMPRKTGYGRELYERVRGYQLFVSGTEKYRAKFFEKEGLFVEVLPYAIMFGVTDKLARAFKEMGIEPQQPTWFHGATTFNAAHFASSMNSFSGSLSSAMASSPSSSGSGGGGSSGGGFGGGGGGSW